MIKHALWKEEKVKIGHTGTLDPSASGVLIICLGRANRLVQYILMHPKEYVGLIRLGTSTDTLDADGKITEIKPVPDFEQDNLDLIARSKFTGEIMQVPPAVSALKKDGERYYVKAQRGEPIEPPARLTRIHELELKKVDSENIELRVKSASGFYVRSLARDVARELSTVGHLDKLVRTSVGPFIIKEAIDPYSIEGYDSIRDKLYPVDYPMYILPRIQIDMDSAKYFMSGIPQDLINMSNPETGSRTTVYSDETFLGIGEVREVEGKIVVVPIKVIARRELFD